MHVSTSCCAWPTLLLLVQVFTLIAAGCVSGILYALAIHTPGRFELNDLVAMRSATLSTTNSTLQGLDTLAAGPPANAALGAQVAEQNKTLYGLGDPKTKWISNQGIISSFQDAVALQAAQLKP